MTGKKAWQQHWPADVLVFISGLLMPLAYAPLAWWPLAIVSLAFLVYSSLDVSIGRASWRGFLFGLGWFGAGVSWVYVSIRLFGNATAGLSATITVLLILVLSLYPAFAVWLARWVSKKGLTISYALVFAATFSLIEWLRGWLFTGFSWLEPGYAFINTPLAQLAPLTGVLGVSFASVLTAAWLVMLIVQKQLAQRMLTAVLLLGLWGGCALIGTADRSGNDGKQLRVALVQGNIPQHRKWLSEEREPTLQMYRRFTEQHWDKDVIIWPETAVPAFEDQVFDYLETLHSAAQLSATSLMTGLVVRESHGDRYYNALITLGNADRGPASLYTKQHLVPFGEYLPLKWLLDPVLGFLEIPMSDFSEGDPVKPLVDAGQYRAGISICFEDAFGEEVRAALPEAHYLVNVSNDAWFGDSLAPHQHLQIARMRALETNRYLLRSTNTGITAIIEPDGTIQGRAGQFEREVLTGTIYALEGATLYVKLGHYPLLLVSFWIVLISGWFQYLSSRRA